VSGLSETRWPPPAEPAALLPIALQRRCGVRAASASLQLAHARDLQARWALRAPELRLSYANSAAAGHAAASPLVRSRNGETTVPNDATVPHWRHAWREAPALEQLDDARAPPFASPERTRGVSTLKAQSRCAFRGFAETRLASDTLAVPTPGFSSSERGILVHRALEFIWSALGSSAALAAIEPARQTALIGAGVESALASACALRDPGGRWRERERVRLEALLPRWLDVERERAPFVIERLEPGRQIAHHAGLEFACRVDRVDRLEDGARVLIDYKTGAASTDWRGDRPDNPQLPVYALLYREALIAVAYGRLNASDLDFTGESERPGVFRPGAKATALEGAASFAALLDVWEARVERLAADFAAGAAAVAPTPAACAHCHLQGLCRVITHRDDEPARGNADD
jgi:probable DNA repair protein